MLMGEELKKINEYIKLNVLFIYFFNYVEWE